jgi:D-3-phosphoglycerate dehydrogenase / 2-oxoglutarate reductase
MRNILCLNNISQEGLSALPDAYKVTEDLNNADAVLVRSAIMHEMVLPERVLAVARAGAGVNNIPLETYAKSGIVVFNTPGANANGVKELTIAGMLLAARDIYGGMKWIEANRDDENINKTMEKAKKNFAGTEILNKSIGVIGLGAVGALVANASGALGMKVIAVEPSKEVINKNKDLLPKDIEIVENIDELYAKSDYISLNLPLIPATKGMINKQSIAKMKDGVIIVNLARDAIVDDDDLQVALKEGKVRRYVTDFPNHRTANMEGVIAIPHLGASTEEAENNCAFMAAKQVVSFIETGTITNSVNYPNIEPCDPCLKNRIVVLHENIEEIPSKIINEIGKIYKVSTITTKSKGLNGVTIIDLALSKDEKLDKNKIEENFASLQGIYRVRVID